MAQQARKDELVRALRRQGAVSVSELTHQLGVSRRTVLRDIDQLRHEGFDIQSSSGPGGGVYLDPASVLVTPKLKSAEVFSMLISIAVLKQLHPMPFIELADAGLRKIEQALPRDRVLALRNILKSVYIGTPNPLLPTPTLNLVEASVLPGFETGFLNSQTLQFGYTDRKGASTFRQADPHALLVMSPAWYLIGYDTDKEDFRHFRLDRKHSVTVLDETFRRRSFVVPDSHCPFKTTFR